MKIFKLLLVSSLLFNSISSKAQATASATAEGTIVSPISIINTEDMNFGNIASSSSSGTVVLNSGGVRTSTGGATLPSTTGTVSRARFAISGEPLYSFVMTVPSSAHTITHTNNTDVMTVDNFATNPAGTLAIGVTGTIGIRVRATLNVGASQLAGFYTSTVGFDVTVNYN